MKSIRRFCVLTLIGVVALSGAQDAAATRINFEIAGTPIRKVLAKLFAGKSSFVLSPAVAGKVSISVRDVGFETVLGYVLRQVDGTYRFVDGVYVITPAEHPEEPRVQWLDPDHRNLMQLENIDVQVALRSLFKSTTPDRKFKIDSRLNGKISGAHSSSTLEESVCWLAEQVGARVRLEEGAYVIEAGKQDKSQAKVPAYDFKNTDVRDAIRTVCNAAHIDYSIAPEVQGYVTGHFEGALEPVLRALVSKARAHLIIESGVYMIVRN